MKSRSRIPVIAGFLALAFAAGVAFAPALITSAAARVTGLDGPAAFAHRGGGGALAAAATYIGITEAELKTELQAGKSLAEVAVARGKTRDGLIAALTQAAGTRIAELVDQKGLKAPGGRAPGGKHAAGLHIEPFAAAAAYLSTTPADLMTRARAGETLAQIAAKTAGKDRAGLIAAIVADAQAKIDAARAAGKITPDQATHLSAGLTDRVTKLVDAAHPARPGGRARP